MKVKKFLSLVLIGILIFSISIQNGTMARAENNLNKEAKDIVSSMSLEEKVGQVLMPSFSRWSDYEVTSVIPNELEDFIERYNFGGVILFGSNFNSVGNAATLTSNYHNLNTRVPLLLAVDQEGGGVTRIEGSTYMNGNMALGAVNDIALTEKSGEIIGKETSSVGVDITFAPVLDVYTNPTNTVIGTRSFGDNSDEVGKHGAAYIRGVQSNGSSATAKHFPGNGEALTDTHAELNINNKDFKYLMEVDLKPFQQAIDVGVDMIMTSHSAYIGLDDSMIYSNNQKKDVYKAATISEKIITKTLKGDMGFGGVVVTDAMDMKAITNYYTESEATLLALSAGCDIILMPYTVRGDMKSLSGFEKYFNEVVRGIEEGKVTQERLDDAVTRVIELKIKRGLINGEKKDKAKLKENAAKVVGSQENKKIEKEIAEKAVTVIKNEGDMLPLKLNEDSKVIVVDYFTILPNGMGATNYGATAVMEALNKIKMEQRFPRMKVDKASIIFEFNSRTGFVPQTNISEIKEKIDEADYIVFAPYQFDTGAVFAPEIFLPSSAKAMIGDLVNYVNEKDKKYAYISVKDPYDIAYLPQLKNAVACYANIGGDIVSGFGYREVSNVDASVRAVFGLADTTGTLPVNIKKANDKNIIYPAGTGIKLKKINEGYSYEELTNDNKITTMNIIIISLVVILIVVAIIVSRKSEKI